MTTAGTDFPIDRIAAADGAADEEPGRNARRSSASRLRAIKADIVEHAASRDLTMTALAARHRVTARYIRKLFEAEGLTFSKFLLDERLARARRLLIDPRRGSDTVSAIAFACGFGDLSYFNRVFRRRNGATPSEVRAAAVRGASEAAGADTDPGAKCGAASI
ncbi:MAG TPA: helix-turn-helix transcriptional regulator [Xanthobacteraceae bacterium]|nr:helix-turn-helix transcriptional regulator [Xanthobacteraceae bacterium]